ncbi:MAG: hypothetical protein F6K48_25475 [Okeania sp. SIO3H1]|nr:hypothetical protein [Okeania sp. SIO3H1]
MAERSLRFLGCRRKKEEGRRKKEEGRRKKEKLLVGCVSGSVTEQTLHPREQDTTNGIKHNQGSKMLPLFLFLTKIITRDLPMLHLKNAICRGEWHSPSVGERCHQENKIPPREQDTTKGARYHQGSKIPPREQDAPTIFVLDQNNYTGLTHASP